MADFKFRNRINPKILILVLLVYTVLGLPYLVAIAESQSYYYGPPLWMMLLPLVWVVASITIAFRILGSGLIANR